MYELYDSSTHNSIAFDSANEALDFLRDHIPATALAGFAFAVDDDSGYTVIAEGEALRLLAMPPAQPPPFWVNNEPVHLVGFGAVRAALGNQLLAVLTDVTGVGLVPHVAKVPGLVIVDFDAGPRGRPATVLHATGLGREPQRAAVPA